MIPLFRLKFVDIILNYTNKFMRNVKKDVAPAIFAILFSMPRVSRGAVFMVNGIRISQKERLAIQVWLGNSTLANYNRRKLIE